MAFESLSVIVPVVSETTSFTETVETVIETCEKRDLKEIIICISCHAPEESKDIARDLCDKYKDIPVYTLTQKGSFEDVIKEIFHTVSGSHFIFQPADLEQDPKNLKIFIEEAKKNPEALITGTRFLNKTTSKNCARKKKIVFFFFRKVFQLMYSPQITDSTFMYQVIPTKRIDNILLFGKSYSVLYEAFLKILRSGISIKELPVEFKNRPDAKSKVRFFKDGLRYIGVFFRVRFSDVNGFYKNADPDV